MSGIGTRFSLVVGLFAIVFSLAVLFLAWDATEARVSELTAEQAKLALEFDRAIRDYAAAEIRPEMQRHLDEQTEFKPEVMSTSFIARSIFHKVNVAFEDYRLKFSSENPRNIENLATPAERRILQDFRDNPARRDWSCVIQIEDHPYYVHTRVMRMEEKCIRCHGRPEDAPRSLRDRYHRAFADRRGGGRRGAAPATPGPG
jgi:hypothetical protein